MVDIDLDIYRAVVERAKTDDESCKLGPPQLQTFITEVESLRQQLRGASEARSLLLNKLTSLNEDFKMLSEEFAGMADSARKTERERDELRECLTEAHRKQLAHELRETALNKATQRAISYKKALEGIGKGPCECEMSEDGNEVEWRCPSCIAHQALLDIQTKQNAEKDTGKFACPNCGTVFNRGYEYESAAVVAEQAIGLFLNLQSRNPYPGSDDKAKIAVIQKFENPPDPQPYICSDCILINAFKANSEAAHRSIRAMVKQDEEEAIAVIDGKKKPTGKTICPGCDRVSDCVPSDLMPCPHCGGYYQNIGRKIVFTGVKS